MQVKKMTPRKVRCGVKKICIFKGVFDLVPPSVEAPLIFLGCWLSGIKGQMCIFFSVQVAEHTIDKCFSGSCLNLPVHK
jgi:hypothetical protein